MSSAAFEKKHQGPEIFTGDGHFARFIALLTGDNDMGMVGAANVRAKDVAAARVDPMEKMYALKVCDDPIERNLAQLLPAVEAIP